jgi:hypothetical protein
MFCGPPWLSARSDSAVLDQGEADTSRSSAHDVIGIAEDKRIMKY